MMKSLELNHVGPVQPLRADFARRLNVFTGDNGLGKSFLLDVCVWALTGTWPQGRMALPEPGQKHEPTISFQVSRRGRPIKHPVKAHFDFRSQTWDRRSGWPLALGIVLYAAVDGSFLVWDPARNYVPDGATGDMRDYDNPGPRPYQFSPESLAGGLVEEERTLGAGNSVHSRTLCNGLIHDWAAWYYEQSSTRGSNPFQYLEEIVALLSHPQEPVNCAEPQRVFVDDIRKFPTLKMPYGIVPFPQWSAGLRRVVSFAYLMVWAWVEHLLATDLRREEPSNRLFLIVDEVESHLHPKWQRTILPALLGVAEKLRPGLEIQLLVATHSPLVLASAEPHFDEDRDKLFWFDLEEGSVSFREYPWAIQGDVDGWLTSPIFGLKEARSREAEDVLAAAEAYMAGDISKQPEGPRARESIQKEMRRVLPGDDPIWLRWLLKTREGAPQ